MLLLSFSFRFVMFSCSSFRFVFIFLFDCFRYSLFCFVWNPIKNELFRNIGITLWSVLIRQLNSVLDLLLIVREINTRYLIENAFAPITCRSYYVRLHLFVIRCFCVIFFLCFLFLFSVVNLLLLFFFLFHFVVRGKRSDSE